MIRRRQTKVIHEGQYAAAVEGDLIEAEEGWSPYLSLTDAPLHVVLSMMGMQKTMPHQGWSRQGRYGVDNRYLSGVVHQCR